MSTAQDELRAMVDGKPGNGKPDEAAGLRALLTETLGVAVTGANVFGRGPNASVDVHLAEGAPLTFERFSDLTKPQLLSAYLVTLTGVVKAFKPPEAAQVAAAIFQLARHHAEASEDEDAREWGSEYLRLAPTMDVDLTDQADRWSAFHALAKMNPARDGGEDRSAFTLAQCSTVLVDRDRSRLVRSGWFQHYVKREVGPLYSPVKLAIQMQRVGWQRQNTQGRVKATNPTDGQCLSMRFYLVAKDWPDA